MLNDGYNLCRAKYEENNYYTMNEAELPALLFENDRDMFRITLYNNTVLKSNISDEETEILEFCKTPRSRKELAELFNGRITIAYLMSKYIHPMIEHDLLGLTIPKAPKSKKQKYYTI